MTAKTSVTLTVTINASAAKVWDALTKPELLKQWMSDAEIEVITDWTVGGPIVVRGKANGSYEYKGTVLQFEPESILQYNSFTKISKLPDEPENYTTITFKLIPGQNQTTLTFTHGNLIAEAAYEHSNFYWASALGVVKKLAEG